MTMRERFQLLCISCCCWWALLLPFDYQLLDPVFNIIRYPFVRFIQALQPGVVFETDTYGTYLLVFFAILLGTLCMPIVGWVIRKTKASTTDTLKTVLGTILFFFLVSYGWNKVVKLQFYRPEPNTVYTPFGHLSKDIAYWSVVGSSYTYTVALGIAELIAAVLLLFKRTQFLASLLCVAVFGQVVLVNFSFDISVKLLSVSLLLFSVLYTLRFSQQWNVLLGRGGTVASTKRSTQTHRLLKAGFTFVVVLEVALSTVISGNLNDDNAPRPLHHGAYRVIGSPNVKRMFIHRNDYLILQLTDDRMMDYPIQQSNEKTTIVRKPVIRCLWKTNQLVMERDTFVLEVLPYRELPLLNDGFHWFSDAFH